MRDLSSAARITAPPKVIEEKELRPPFRFPIGVRTALTITTLDIFLCSPYLASFNICSNDRFSLDGVPERREILVRDQPVR